MSVTNRNYQHKWPNVCLNQQITVAVIRLVFDLSEYCLSKYFYLQMCLCKNYVISALITRFAYGSSCVIPSDSLLQIQYIIFQIFQILSLLPAYIFFFCNFVCLFIHDLFCEGFGCYKNKYISYISYALTSFLIFLLIHLIILHVTCQVVVYTLRSIFIFMP